jgi:hypothetical protein
MNERYWETHVMRTGIATNIRNEPTGKVYIVSTVRRRCPSGNIHWECKVFKKRWGPFSAFFPCKVWVHVIDDGRERAAHDLVVKAVRESHPEMWWIVKAMIEMRSEGASEEEISKRITQAAIHNAWNTRSIFD